MEKEELEREVARQGVSQLEHAEIQSLVRSFSK
jgi:hypothetical protein